jgi:hypothetical protein
MGKIAACCVAVIILALAAAPARAEQKWVRCTLDSRLPDGVASGVPNPETPHTRIFVLDVAGKQLLEYAESRLEPRSSGLTVDQNNRLSASADPGSPAESYLIDRISGKISIDHCAWGSYQGRAIQDCSSTDWSEFGACEATSPMPSAQPKF